MSQRRRQSGGRGEQSSQRVSKHKSRDEEDDYDEEDEPTQVVNKGKKRARASSSQIPSSQLDGESQVQISAEEKEKLVGDTVRFILAQDSHKLPVKRGDINNNYKKEKKLFGYVIDKAKKIFLDVFGYELKEVKKGKDASGGAFILKSMINPKLREQFVDKISDLEIKQRGLLLTILGMIATNNNEIDQDTLYEQLKRLGLREGEEHPIFGEWEKYIEITLTKQLYLERKKTDRRSAKTGKLIHDFKTGPRSVEEIGRRGILEYVAHTYGEELDAVQLKQLELDEQQMEDEDDDDNTQPSQSQR